MNELIWIKYSQEVYKSSMDSSHGNFDYPKGNQEKGHWCRNEKGQERTNDIQNGMRNSMA